jgi:hypothetical protein
VISLDELEEAIRIVASIPPPVVRIEVGSAVLEALRKHLPCVTRANELFSLGAHLGGIPIEEVSYFSRFRCDLVYADGRRERLT